MLALTCVAALVSLAFGAPLWAVALTIGLTVWEWAARHHRSAATATGLGALGILLALPEFLALTVGLLAVWWLTRLIP